MVHWRIIIAISVAAELEIMFRKALVGAIWEETIVLDDSSSFKVEGHSKIWQAGESCLDIK